MFTKKNPNLGVALAGLYGWIFLKVWRPRSLDCFGGLWQVLSLETFFGRFWMPTSNYTCGILSAVDGVMLPPKSWLIIGQYRSQHMRLALDFVQQVASIAL